MERRHSPNWTPQKSPANNREEESRLVDIDINRSCCSEASSIAHSLELIPAAVNEKKDCKQNETETSRLRRLSRSLGLESIYLLSYELLGKYHPIEEKKVAFLYDLRTACYVSLIHIVPAAASVTLVVFNWKGYYIGSELSGPSGEDGLKFLGLQFAAKMLELIAMGSLSCILFDLVRYQLVFGDYLPFGAMTAGFEFSRISLLWSREFMATCATEFSSWKRKFTLIATIVVFTILGASVGPSAAVAALPTLKDWQAGGTRFSLNGTAQDIWPSILDTVATADLPCLSAENTSCFPSNYGLIASEILSLWPVATVDGFGLSQAMPENTRLSGRHALRDLAMRFKGPFTYQPDLTVATMPSAAIADAVSTLGRYWFIANMYECIKRNLKSGFCYYNDIYNSVTAPQPVTFVRCNANAINTILQFPRLDQGFGIFPLVDFGNETFASNLWNNGSASNETIPSLSWIELSDAEFGNNSIGAIVVLPSTDSSSRQVLSCTVDARWANATTSVSFLGGPLVASGSPNDWYTTGRQQTLSGGGPVWPQVKITPSWAHSQYPNSTLGSSASISVFADLVNSLGRLNNISNVPYPVNAIEAILAIMITDGMARTGSTATIQGSLKGFARNSWQAEMLPQKTVFGYGGDAFNFSPNIAAASFGYTKFEMRTTVNGYGYGISTASLLSTITLLVYATIALSYVVYSTFFARTTSSAWDSITEIIALAMNSRPPLSNNLENTGAGISTLKTLKSRVRIGVRDEQMQMCFDDRDDVVRVLRNESYG